MTTNDPFEATLSSWLDETASAPVPAAASERLLAVIATRRPRPTSLAWLGSHWISAPSGRAWPGGLGIARPALGVSTTLLLLLLLLALALVGSAALIGGQRRQVMTPSPVPDSPPPSIGRPNSVGQSFPDVIPAVGPLAAGTYSSLDVDNSGTNVRFTVPAGWSWDGRSLRKDGTGPPAGAAILFFGQAMDIQVNADPCRWKAGPSTVTANTIDRVVAALARQPSRSPTTPPNRWVPGIHFSGEARGVMVELTVPADLDLASCDDSEYRSWSIGGVSRSHEGAGQRDQVSVLDIYGVIDPNDVGGSSGQAGFIVDAASFPDTSSTVMAEIEAILDSIYLGHWG